MTKHEFLRRLEEALVNEVEPSVIRENLKYYEEYIGEEVKKGRTEEEVLEELGDPWAIARTISDMAETGSQEPRSPQHRADYEEERTESRGSSVQINTGRWGCILWLVIGILAVIAIGALIAGIISTLLPILLPILVIVVIVRIFAGRS